jgi:predicted Zn-dependent peptidase
VREERGLAYAVGSSTARYSDSGALVVSAGTAPGRLAELCEVIDAELERLVADGVTEGERDRAVGYVVGATRLGLEDTGSRMVRLAGEELTWGRIESIDEQLARLRAVTAEDVSRVLGRVLDARRAVAAVGPVSAEHHSLAAFAAWRR